MVLPLPLLTPLTVVAALIIPTGTRSFKSASTIRAVSRRQQHIIMPATNTANGEGQIVKRIGIIGGGAAGLATARSFLRVNEEQSNGVIFDVTVLETLNCIGGVWKYEDDETKQQSKSRPMYRNLRTNLPRELMAYKEFPWGGDGIDASYVTHKQVQQYLEDYANNFNLQQYIHFGCKVNQLKVLNESDRDDDVDSWPQISLEWTDNATNQSYEQTFDSVCICNGHYAQPSNPPLPGLENFNGKIIHAIEYDDPNDYVGQTVLCIGARASGADIAREIALVTKRRTYLSDSTCHTKQEYGNVILMPRTQSIDEDGKAHFASSMNEEEKWSVNDVDVIIFCSGYDYSFPFINEESKLELQTIPGERRVTPLYEQMWHAQYPSLSFIGLPHSVVPFPLFEIQSTAVVSQLTSRVGSIPLPSLSERMAAADKDANSGGPDTPGRVVDTHFLGSYQWDYCRKIAKIGGVHDDAMENYIATNKAIYDRSGKERKSMTPGGDDLYRETRFSRLEDEQSYKILHSEIEPAQVKV